MTQPLGPPTPPNSDKTFAGMNHALTKSVPHSLINAKKAILHMRRMRRKF